MSVNCKKGFLVAFALLLMARGAVVDVVSKGGIVEDDSIAVQLANRDLVNKILADFPENTEILFPRGTMHILGGIYASGLRNVTFRLEGTLAFSAGRKHWPTSENSGRVLHCITLDNAEGVTLTSSAIGTLDGHGEQWWGVINYAIYGENRPKLLVVRDSSFIIVEHWMFKNSAYWTTSFEDVSDVTIRYSNVSVHWTDAQRHDATELQAFNTDGFDLSGRNIHVHDCNIWNDDDCVTVKSLGNGGKRARCSENWLVERVNASGVGLTIGSIGASSETTCVRNITFRDSTMVNSFKGIYMKSRPASDGNTAVIRDILYENITLIEPSQWAIWIGPAQQADTTGACSLLWPNVPGQACPVPAQFDWDNITLRNIRIVRPKSSPGVIIGNLTNPMQNIVFDNVVVEGEFGAIQPWGAAAYACYGVNGTAMGGTHPVPPCFNGGPQCTPEGQCVDKASTPCCSGRKHTTLACGDSMARCGCLPRGGCAVAAEGCCSRKCGTTLSCGLGVGCKCL